MERLGAKRFSSYKRLMCTAIEVAAEGITRLEFVIDADAYRVPADSRLGKSILVANWQGSPMSRVCWYPTASS